MSLARCIFLSGVILAATVSGIALAETGSGTAGSSSDPPSVMQQHQPGMMPMAGHHAGMMEGSAVPTLPGQDAFGAVQEIVRILEADPSTDWSRVKMAALREHLIDMNEVTLQAVAAELPIDNGLRIDVTGSGRTLAAIQRMLPAHAREIDGLHGWSVAAAPLPDGVQLTVTTADPNEVAHIRGLGFIGLMASGAHHQPHHLAMARGEDIH